MAGAAGGASEQFAEGDLPGWFHGALSRTAAEGVLDSEGHEAGLFLVRESTSTQGYVLSLCCAGGQKIHYQIRHVQVEGQTFLTFDTETATGPKFRSLVSVIHYLIQNPIILDAPLRRWVSVAPSSPIYESPNAIYATTGQSPERKPSFHSDLNGALTDGLAALGIVTDDPLLVSLTPGVVDDMPKLKVLRKGSARSPGKDTLTGESVYLDSGAELALVKVDRVKGGKLYFICRDDRDRLLSFPQDSHLQVAPKIVYESTYEEMAPPVPHRQAHTLPKRKVSLTELMKDQTPLHQSGWKGMGADHDTESVFFREVIMEGYMSKLPPKGNRIKVWRRRYFKLVISLYRAFSTGPVKLEYYTRPDKPTAKGFIDLDSVERISRPPADVKYKNADMNCVFEIVLAKRTYPCLCDSSAAVDQWLDTLREILGLNKNADEVPRPQFSVIERKQYRGTILHKGLNNHEAILEVSSSSLALVDPETAETIMTWSYHSLREHGYLRQILWFEIFAAKNSSDSGLFCFSCAQAQEIYNRITQYAEDQTGHKRRVRFSRRENMSWSSLDEEAAGDQAAIAGPAASVTLAGKKLPSEDLEPVAYGLALSARTAESPDELSFHEGETLHLLASKAFTDAGFWVAQKASGRETGLVPTALVQVHEHEFGNLRDIEDNLRGSQDSLLQGVTPELLGDVEYGFGLGDADGCVMPTQDSLKVKGKQRPTTGMVGSLMSLPRTDVPDPAAPALPKKEAEPIYDNSGDEDEAEGVSKPTSESVARNQQRSLYQKVRKDPNRINPQRLPASIQEQPTAEGGEGEGEDYAGFSQPFGLKIDADDEEGYAEIEKEPAYGEALADPECQTVGRARMSRCLSADFSDMGDYIDAEDGIDGEDYENVHVKGKHGYLPPPTRVVLPSGKQLFFEPPKAGTVQDIRKFVASVYPKQFALRGNIDMSQDEASLHSFRVGRIDVTVVEVPGR